MAKLNLVNAKHQFEEGNLISFLSYGILTSEWIIDSNANWHMIGNLKLMHNYYNDCKSSIKIVDGTIIYAHRTICSRMLAVSSLVDSNSIFVVFNSKKAILPEKINQTTIGKVVCKHDLYIIQSEDDCTHTSNSRDRTTML